MTTREGQAVTADDLHAYVDGRLDPQRRAVVEQHLAGSPEDVARVAGYRSLNTALQSLHADVLDEPVPARLLEPKPARREGMARLAASIAWLMLGMLAGVGGGWWMWGDGPGAGRVSRALAERAVVAHAVYSAEVRHPVEVGVEQRNHLVGWLSKRLGGEVRTPDLRAEGYALVGGRLLPGDTGPAAQFMYETDGGERLTLYVKTGETGNRQTAFRVHSVEGVTVIYWIDGPFGYALSGALGRDELETLAHRVYEQLTP